jgi:hypothetical protein
MKRLRNVRKMTYVVWAWCLAIVAWAISASSHAAACTGTYANDCAAGTGVAVLFILFIGFFGFVFLAVIWFMTRPSEKRRPKP